MNPMCYAARPSSRRSRAKAKFKAWTRFSAVFLFDNGLNDTLPPLFAPGAEIKQMVLSGNRFERLPPWLTEIKITNFDRSEYFRSSFDLRGNPLRPETKVWLRQRYSYLGDRLEFDP